MKKIILLFALVAVLAYKSNAQTVTDYDGNIYDTIHIGTQVWLKQNLKTRHYLNGDSIPNVKANNSWSALTTGAYCNYMNDTNNGVTYGKLYNWFAVNDSRKICPSGWHVPSDGEWNIMIKRVDASVDTTLTGYQGTNAGWKLKETGTTHWTTTSASVNNSSGFTALPGGHRYTGIFYNLHTIGYWWTQTPKDTYSSWYRYLNDGSSQVGRSYANKNDGRSVRCIKDYPTTQIQNINDVPDFQIYPNPVSNKLNIECPENQKINLQTYNLLGQCVIQLDLIKGTNELDVSLLPKGLYVIRLIGNDWSVEKKFIKE